MAPICTTLLSCGWPPPAVPANRIRISQAARSTSRTHRAVTPALNAYASRPEALLRLTNHPHVKHSHHLRGGTLPRPAAVAEAVTQIIEPPDSISKDIEPQPEAAASSSYPWTKQWWPAFPISYLDPSRPHALTLLGQKLVVWRDGTSTWRVFKDACPHRLAALSEGRLEADGTLQCAYHGWRFSGGGACTTIPQAIDATAQATACASSRSCATAYPTQEKLGLLWVWPESGPIALLESAAAAPLLSNAIHQWLPEATKAGRSPNWYMRDLSYGYEVLMENICDPAHLPFSHHGVGNLNRKNGKAMPMNPTPYTSATSAPTPTPTTGSSNNSIPQHSAIGSALPLAEYTFVGNVAPNAKLSFHPPYSIMYDYQLQGPMASIHTELLVIPVSPGRSRLFNISYSLANPAHAAPPPASSGFKLMTPQQIWAALIARFKPPPFSPATHYTSHLFMHTILDGDSMFLKHQEQRLQSPELRNQWGKAYYLPTQCDAMVVAARKWIDTEGGGGPFGSVVRNEQVAPPLDRHQVLDRYNQHTRYCRQCQVALQQVEKLAKYTKAAQAVLLLLAYAGVGALGALAATAGGRAVLAVAAGQIWPLLLGLAVPAALYKIRDVARKLDGHMQQFHFVDYVHSEKH